MSRTRLALLVVAPILAVYWRVLYIATHIHSGPKLPGQSDKLIHFAAYMVLGILAAAAVRLLVRGGWWKYAVVWLVLTLYGAADELTQTPPRQPDWKDWAMDTAGAAFGVAALANFRRKKSLPAE